MRVFVFLASALALSSSSAIDVFNDDEGLSLLQLRAAASPKIKGYSNDSRPTYNGHAFGCTGRTTAVNVISCGLWGDVHQHKQYGGTHAPNSDGTGWYWVAKSKDDSFQAQAFYRQGPGWTTMSHFAMKFGDKTVFMDRNLEDNRWIWKYFWDGQERSYADTPLELGDVYWANKGAGAPMAQEGAQQTANTAHAVIGADHERLSCFEYKQVAMWTSFQDWQNPSMGPHGQGAVLEVEGSIDFLDPDFGQCAFRQQKVQPSEMLVTIPQNEKVCSDDKLNKHQCEDPDPPPPPPTKEELCEQNGVEMQHAQDLCADQQAHGGDIYEDCLYDVCASADADAQMNAVGGAELEAAMMNPEAKCVIKSDSCLPCDICATSKAVDLSNIVQNNLGGLGPDTGAEEIRYSNAIDIDGRKLDVVLTALGEYKTPKPEKNGNSPAGFGKFTMKTKSSTNFKFQFVDSETGEPVGVKDLALTFYDLDQAKKTQQQETITACGAEEVYTTTDTELAHDASGLCHSFTSTVRGTGKDNPQRPDDLTKTQAARSVTFEFHSRASISFTAEITGKGKTPRPVLFSFEPQVACGASDAETRCAQ